jgi:predicted dienelactone hydrolase
MKDLRIFAAAGLALLAAATVTAQQPPGSWTVPEGARVTVDRQSGRFTVLMPREVIDRTGSAARFEQWRKTPYAGKGPLPATRVEDPALPTHTLYFPAGLPATAGKLPVLLWANGGCRNTSIEFTAFLGELASHGYFIVANGRNDVPFATADLNTNPRPNGQPPVQVLGGATVLAGLDWISKENSRQGSAYYDKLDLTKIAALGQSCGGGQVWEASKDSRIKAVAALNSSFPTERVGFAPGAAPPTDGWTVEKLAKPAAFFIGGPADIAYGPSQASFAAAPATASVIKANLPLMGHTGAYSEPYAEWSSAVTAWLDWQLRGDAKAKAMFVGADCGLCKDANWWFEAKPQATRSTP